MTVLLRFITIIPQQIQMSGWFFCFWKSFFNSVHPFFPLLSNSFVHLLGNEITRVHDSLAAIYHNNPMFIICFKRFKTRWSPYLSRQSHSSPISQLLCCRSVDFYFEDKSLHNHLGGRSKPASKSLVNILAAVSIVELFTSFRDKKRWTKGIIFALCSRHVLCRLCCANQTTFHLARTKKTGLINPLFNSQRLLAVVWNKKYIV